MKNSRYYPHERNNYFKGKLLTVRDFESEQTYVNNKRRLLNRLLYGSGVVSGLQVVRVDDHTVSVQAGVAFDCLGREIVVPAPKVVKLSKVEGYIGDSDCTKNVYLCMAYEEKDREPIYSVSNASDSTGDPNQYNRILETYRLFIKEELPDFADFEYRNLTTQAAVLYEDEQTRIWQTAPRYVNPGQIFEVTVHIEKSPEVPSLTLAYEVRSEMIYPLDLEQSVISFSEQPGVKRNSYELKYRMKAGNREAEGTLSISPSSSMLTLGDNQYALNEKAALTVAVINGSINDKVTEQFFERPFERAVAYTPDQCIYLARISLVVIKPAYIIDEVKSNPFDEYIYNSMLQYTVGKENAAYGGQDAPLAVQASVEMLPPGQAPNLTAEVEPGRNEIHLHLALPAVAADAVQMTTGTATIETNYRSTGLFTKAEQSFYSDEIAHGLGAGQAFVVLGLEEYSEDRLGEQLNREEKVYFGDRDVFKNSEFGSELMNASLAAVVYPKAGTFRIGIKLSQASERDFITVRWWAYKRAQTSGAIQTAYSQTASSKEGV
ncbi:hypothetical protein ACFQI7_30470 [Paenibacillus allorhizosphaerae]|uniref:DUF4139 domain-containing protein n=1 Tax=Paenibacillus allorhizosphaerae TaxID=2849866 RepID=A0ABM8VH30_9BACL|nr:hypothetical protein [Paenibacillus allorhizosphaerae]CAG7640708.1 hypothetical protein PAECIP111802_02676 [Paenibacillus allorhizosphaerae]